MDDFDYGAWIESNAPQRCDTHDQPRHGWCGVCGFYGIAYRCGCAWGSDDGRGEGWSRYIDVDRRALSELPPCADCGSARSGWTNGCTTCPEWECGTRYACPDCGPLNGSRYRSELCHRREIMRGNGTQRPRGILDQVPVPTVDELLRPARAHVGGGVYHVLDDGDCPFCRELSVLCRCGR